MIKETTRELLLCSKRLWRNTIKQMWSVEPCAKDHSGLRAMITFATIIASMNLYQVRIKVSVGLNLQEMLIKSNTWLFCSQQRKYQHGHRCVVMFWWLVLVYSYIYSLQCQIINIYLGRLCLEPALFNVFIYIVYNNFICWCLADVYDSWCSFK